MGHRSFVCFIMYFVANVRTFRYFFGGGGARVCRAPVLIPNVLKPMHIKEVLTGVSWGGKYTASRFRYFVVLCFLCNGIQWPSWTQVSSSPPSQSKKKIRKDRAPFRSSSRFLPFDAHASDISPARYIPRQWAQLRELRILGRVWFTAGEYESCLVFGYKGGGGGGGGGSLPMEMECFVMPRWLSTCHFVVVADIMS